MSGPIHTLKNYLITGSFGVETNRRFFEGVAQFFDGHPGYQRIAWKDDGVGGEENFKVWRAVSGTQKFDVIVKWSFNDFWSSWNIGNAYGVGIAIGAHDSGEAWNGTTNNPTDAAVTPPFKAGSIVMARSVAVGGDITGSKDTFFHFSEDGVSHYTLLNASGDNDSFTIVLDVGNTGVVTHLFHFERFVPVNPEYKFPYFLYTNGNTPLGWFEANTTYGSLTLADAKDACVAYISTSGGSVTGSLPIPEKVQLDFQSDYSFPFAISTSYFPYVSEYPIALISMETGGEYVGHLSALRRTYQQIRSYSRLDNQTRMVISQSYSENSPTLTMNWSGSAASGSSYSGSLFLTGSSTIGRSGLSGYYIDRLGTTDSIVTVVSQTIVTNNYLYRGRIGANYVFQVGTQPAGATDIVIMGIV